MKREPERLRQKGIKIEEAQARRRKADIRIAALQASANAFAENDRTEDILLRARAFARYIETGIVGPVNLTNQCPGKSPGPGYAVQCQKNAGHTGACETIY